MSIQTCPHCPPSVSIAVEAVQLAQRALDDALIDNLDTAGTRATLAAVQEALAAAEAAAAQAANVVAASERRAAQQAEAAAMDAAQEQVAEAFETIESAPGAEPLPEPTLPPMVALAAQQVARARAALERAQAPHCEAIAARDALRSRMTPKEAELAAIRTRRAAGDERAGDAATMTALNMDIEDLRRMLTPLENAVAAALPAAQQQTVVAAEAALAKAKVNAELDAMVARVRALEQHFVAQVRTLRLEAQKRGHNNFGSVFVASDALRKVSNGAWV